MLFKELFFSIRHLSLSQLFHYIVHSKDIFISLIALIFIAVYILLRFVFNVPDIVQNLPLYLVLTVGGIPLVFDLIFKLARFQFSSDLLAGISIITAVLLEQYLAGSLVVLML